MCPSRLWNGVHRALSSLIQNPDRFWSTLSPSHTKTNRVVDSEGYETLKTYFVNHSHCLSFNGNRLKLLCNELWGNGSLCVCILCICIHKFCLWALVWDGVDDGENRNTLFRRDYEYYRTPDNARAESKAKGLPGTSSTEKMIVFLFKDIYSLLLNRQFPELRAGCRGRVLIEYPLYWYKLVAPAAFHLLVARASDLFLLLLIFYLSECSA